MEKLPNPFDEFLKETLKGHQLAPPEEAKKAFLIEASAILTTSKSWFKWYYILVLVVLISGTIAVIFLQDINVPVNPSEITAENLYQGQKADSNLKSISSQVSNPEHEANPAVQSIPAKAELAVTRTPSTNAPLLPASNTYAGTHPEKKGDHIMNKQEEPVSDARSIVIVPDKLMTETSSSRLVMDSLSTSGIPKISPVSENKTAGIDTVTASPSFNTTGPDEPEQVMIENYWTASAYYLPEWMFNTVEGGKFVNNFGIEGNFYHGRISIRTGIGISISKGTTDKSIEYNNYLGTYNKLDSITFIYNEGSHDFMPNIYTSKEKVWDSVAEFDSSSIVKRYTYLQVPLVLGFDFWQRGRLSVGVRIGTIMSVMLQSKQIAGTYDPGENLVLGIQNLTPDQVSINWQAIGGFNASVALSKSFYFEFEPEAKYYYQSIYEKSGYIKKPWSVGIRAAVMYKF